MKAEYLLHRELEHVLSALTPENRVVMQTCLHTGLRIGDVLALRRSDIARRFWVTEKKTGKRRMVGLPDALRAEILRLSQGSEWAFPGRWPEMPRTRQAVWADVKRAQRAFRLPMNLAPHSARKVYAVELMSKYGDIERVRRALNHSSESVTMLYAMADRLTHRPMKRAALPGRRTLG